MERTMHAHYLVHGPDFAMDAYRNYQVVDQKITMKKKLPTH